MTIEEFKAKYAKMVYCNAQRCKNWVGLPEGEEPHHVPNFPGHEPLGELDKFTGVCGKPELAIRDQGKTMLSGAYKEKIAKCMSYAPPKEPYGFNFADMLQSDGTPYGGSIESQSWEHGETGYI